MRNLTVLAVSKAQALGMRILNRLTGFPEVTMRYRADWHIFSETHTTILALIENSPRGELARHMIPLWFEELEQ
jgi:hypothetical protein